LKQNPTTNVDSTTGSLPAGVVAMLKGVRVQIAEFGAIDEKNKHRKIKCEPQIDGKTTWYVFASHVAISP